MEDRGVTSSAFQGFILGLFLNALLLNFVMTGDRRLFCIFLFTLPERMNGVLTFCPDLLLLLRLLSSYNMARIVRINKLHSSSQLGPAMWKKKLTQDTLSSLRCSGGLNHLRPSSSSSSMSFHQGHMRTHVQYGPWPQQKKYSYDLISLCVNSQAHCGTIIIYSAQWKFFQYLSLAGLMFKELYEDASLRLHI